MVECNREIVEYLENLVKYLEALIEKNRAEHSCHVHNITSACRVLPMLTWDVENFKMEVEKSMEALKRCVYKEAISEAE
mgnify:CR=1 FL=1